MLALLAKRDTVDIGHATEGKWIDSDTYVAEQFSAQQLERELGDANPTLLLVEYHGTHSFKLGNDVQQDHIMRLDL